MVSPQFHLRSNILTLEPLILCDTFADEYFDCKMKCFLNGLKIAFILHRIHKTLLDLVEDHYAEGEEDNHEDEAVDEPSPADEFSCA